MSQEQQKDKETERIALQKWILGIVSLSLLCGALAIIPLHAQNHGDHQQQSSQLVEDVRNATRRFIDVTAATQAGYDAAFGCVSGPDHGAMGIHYVNLDLVKKNELSIDYPQALIYEPIGNKRELVGVEYIVDATTWLKNNKGVTPALDGQDFQFVGSPNRFNLDPFFELHVWAWRDNPQGAYVDWNNHVSCEGE
jgi:hypothetical protein